MDGGPVFVLVMLFGTANAGTHELVNDSCICDGTSESLASYAGSFAYGECWASVFVPSAGDYPFTPAYVQLLLAPNGMDANLGIGLYALDGNNQPTELYSTETAYEVFFTSGSTQYLYQLNLADLKIGLPPVTSGNLAVVLCPEDEVSGREAYGPVSDDAGTGESLDYEDRNWLFVEDGAGYSWMKSADAGIHGDFVIRLGIDDGGGDTDTDSDTDTDTDTDTDAGTLELYAVSPATVTEGDAVYLVLSGQGFVTGATATIGGLTVTGATVENAGTVSGKSPTALPAGVHDVQVVNPDGGSAVLTGAFTVESADKGGCGCFLGPQPVGVGLVWALPALAFVYTRRRVRP